MNEALPRDRQEGTPAWGEKNRRSGQLNRGPDRALAAGPGGVCQPPLILLESLLLRLGSTGLPPEGYFRETKLS